MPESKQVSNEKTDTRLQLTLPPPTGAHEIISPDALDFVVALHDKFANRVSALLDARKVRQAELNAGTLPDFLPHDPKVHDDDWQVASIPADLQDRRVEITGPTDRKMVINALNSGARVFMADFEDSLTPTWNNLLEGQTNLRDANRRNIDFTSDAGKEYKLNKDHAVLIVRPRGWHLPEKHALVDDKPIPGALFDFGLYLFHNAEQLQKNGSGPYFYLPKLESHREAALWNDVFVFAEDYLKIKQGTIRATVLIETITAAFEMEEILYELRNYIVGLNCGRWDYIFSYIKKFHAHAKFVLSDRSQVTMGTHFLRSYSQLLIKTCHKHGAFAMGGMAAQIPVKNDKQANKDALAKVRADKEREANDGHDGTWVAHPALVPIAREIFDAQLNGDNQLDVKRDDVQVTAQDLLAVPEGTITETGYHGNVDVALHYMAAWLSGSGCVPLNHLMEDAATAEIARAQLWQWQRFDCQLDDGTPINAELFAKHLDSALNTALENNKDKGDYFTKAADLLRELVNQEDFEDFLTRSAYNAIVTAGE